MSQTHPYARHFGVFIHALGASARREGLPLALKSAKPESVPQAGPEDEAIASSEHQPTADFPFEVNLTAYRTGPVDLFLAPQEGHAAATIAMLAAFKGGGSGLVWQIEWEADDAFAKLQAVWQAYRDGTPADPEVLAKAEAQERERAEQAKLRAARDKEEAAARALPLPARFTNQREDNTMVFTDTKTGRTLRVGLCEWRGARDAIAVFFQDDTPTA